MALPRLSSFVTAIGRSAFSTCTALNVVQWHAPKLKYIGPLAFEGCSALVLPNGLPGDLKKIDIVYGAFRECTNSSAKAMYQIDAINADALL